MHSMSDIQQSYKHSLLGRRRCYAQLHHLCVGLVLLQVRRFFYDSVLKREYGDQLDVKL
jgi:hypothetical protein